MSYFDAGDQGWAEYPDERVGLGPIGGFTQLGALTRMGAMGGLNYQPDLAPVGTGSSYWPRDVDDDIDALEYLGFLSGGSSSSRGSQSADMAAQSGAWDSRFRAAISAFQRAAGRWGYSGAVDSWVGPNTRKALLVAVNEKNASETPESPVIPPYVIPPIAPAPSVPPYTPPSPAPAIPTNVLPPSVLPTPAPAIPGSAAPTPAAPAAAAKKDNTMTYVVVGGVALLLVGVGAWALLD